MPTSPTPNVSKTSTPPITLPKPPNPEWIALLDRLKIQPRPGELAIGSFNASLTDVFAPEPDARTPAAKLLSDYQKDLLEKAQRFENELKALRAEYDAKIVATLPEARRESAQNFLELGRARSADAAVRDAKIRAGFLEKLRQGAAPQPSNSKLAIAAQPGVASGPTQPGAEASAWMREERVKAARQDDETAAALRETLNPEEAARFDRFNRFRPAIPPAQAKNGSAVPAPVVSAPAEQKKEGAQEKK